jgi:hypothetical protein
MSSCLFEPGVSVRKARGMRKLLLALIAVVAVGCSTSPAPASNVSRSPVATDQATAAQMQTASPSPTVAPTVTVTAPPVAVTGLSGQAGVGKAMTDPGTLGMTLTEFVARWNTVLDQGQYPLEEAPTRTGATFSFALTGASDTMLVGVLNDDGSVRAVDAISVAGGISDSVDRSMAQLEAVVVWSTLGRAVNPRLTETEGNMVLTNLGYPSGARFGLLPPLVLDLEGVRYYIIEGDASTNLVARQTN